MEPIMNLWLLDGDMFIIVIIIMSSLLIFMKTGGKNGE